MIHTNDVWEEFSDNIYYYILKKVKDEDIAKDLRQDVFIKIHLNLDSLKEKEKLSSWVYSITRNVINDFYRTNRERFTNDLPEIQYDEKIYGDHEQIFCCLRPFINKLPAKYKETFILSELKGRTNKEIAEKLNISVSASKSRVQRARDMLKKDFISCCNYKLGKDGKLYGEENCTKCA